MDQVESLITDNRNYVAALARQIAAKLPSNVDFDELVAYGQLGLVEAANQYQPDRGVAFTTFAYYRIRGAIFDGVRKSTWLPPAMRKQFTQLAGENTAIEQTANQVPTDDPEILASRFTDSVARLGTVFLLSQATDEDDNPIEPVDESSPDEPTLKSETLSRVKKAFENLPPDQLQVIQLHYIEDKSITEIAQTLGKNKSTISRRHTAAIDALRAQFLDSS